MKRYKPAWTTDSEKPYMYEDPQGEYVRHEDVQNRIEDLQDLVCKPASPAGYALKAEIRNGRSSATDEYDSYLVLVSEGKSWPYMHIPEDMPDHVLEEALRKLNA